MIESEPNLEKGTFNVGDLEEPSPYFFDEFLLTTVKTCTPKLVDKVFEKFCKTIQLEYWEIYKHKMPRNIINNHASMLIADFAYRLDPSENDTPEEAKIKYKTIYYLINARSSIFSETRHKKRVADKYADDAENIIRQVDEDMARNKIKSFSSKLANFKRRSVETA